MIQYCHICESVVLIVPIRRIFNVIPVFRWANVLVEERVFRLALVVDRVESYDLVAV